MTIHKMAKIIKASLMIYPFKYVCFVLGTGLWAYNLTEEWHLYIRIYEGCCVSNKGFGNIGHNTGVYSGKTFCSVHYHVKPSPRPFRAQAFRKQEVPGGGQTFLTSWDTRHIQHASLLCHKKISYLSICSSASLNFWDGSATSPFPDTLISHFKCPFTPVRMSAGSVSMAHLLMNRWPATARAGIIIFQAE